MQITRYTGFFERESCSVVCWLGWVWSGLGRGGLGRGILGLWFGWDIVVGVQGVKILKRGFGGGEGGGWYVVIFFGGEKGV